MDRLTSILLFAGLGCFALAFVLSAWYPYVITDGKVPMATIAELAEDVSVQFKQLKSAYPVSFSEFPGAAGTRSDDELRHADETARSASDAAWSEAYAHALRRGRDRYIGEACWHCHSQFVRPAANEVQRYGPVQTAAHDNNALQRPVLWGTRRVGPDLTHEGGKRSNDWHVAHFKDPTSTSPDSVMPTYPWLFRDGFQVVRTIDPDKATRNGLSTSTTYKLPGLHADEAGAKTALDALKAALDPQLQDEAERMSIEAADGPNAEALALIAYLQWLGTWDPASKGAN